MTLLWICVLWVFASAGIAVLPLRQQFLPGAFLLLTGPLLILLIAFQVGWFMALLALAAFGSMFRNPLMFLWAKLRGQNPALPQ
ncbi:UDP-N-acetylmuramate-L-alanine ligase [Sulfitobacter noctilucicola]|uniref:Cell division protein FtsX n=1 Tax=Sulfitobacter noctilucicola TaxID=1342301 RepID=A0A7W6M8A0_9RHOB|nr:DUF2484 family protein [Sulfitobacter noctilucicola]KIN64593.1 UDP-N-acetylmuramate-L-alanine ligase [Sulfitobacter noctilucicola]MBB4174255.1 cell division protein FtsX [Sulfitobacter noctilucicola]